MSDVRTSGCRLHIPQPPTPNPRRAALVTPVLLAALAAAIRLAYWRMPVQCDEALVYIDYCINTRRPIFDAIAHVPRLDNHALVSLLGALGYSLFNWGFPWFRIPALLFGIACVPATYLSLRRMIGSRSAMLAALMVALSSFAIRYSIEYRGYTAALFFGVVAIGLVWRALLPLPLRESSLSETRLWLAAGLTFAAAIYAVITTALLCASTAIAVVLMGLLGWVPRRQAIRGSFLLCVTAFGAAACMIAPMHLRWGLRLPGSDSVAQNFHIRDLWWEGGRAVHAYLAMLSDGVLPLFCYLAAAIVGFIVLFRRRRQAAVFLASILLIPFPLLLVCGVLPPDRVMTFLLPIGAALAAVGLDAFWCHAERSEASPDVGCRKSEVGCGKWDVGCGMSDVGCKNERLSSSHSPTPNPQPPTPNPRHPTSHIPHPTSRMAVPILLASWCFATMIGRWPYPSDRATVLEDYGPVAAELMRLDPPPTRIYAQSALLKPLQYHLHRLGADPAIVRLPRRDGKPGVLVYRPVCGLSENMRSLLAGCRLDRCLVRIGPVDVVQIVPLQSRDREERGGVSLEGPFSARSRPLLLSVPAPLRSRL